MADKPILNILWIDDQYDLCKYLAAYFVNTFSNECDIVITPIDDVSEMNQTLGYLESFDVILADHNLDDETNGAELLERIRACGCVADVILYSENEQILSHPLTLALGHFAFTEIVHRRDNLEQRVPRLIKKHIEKTADIFVLRGLLLADFIALELKANEFLLNYYDLPGHKKDEFKMQFLENPYLGVFTKQQVLGEIEKKLSEQNSSLKDLARQARIALCENTTLRNKVAHYREENGKLVSGNSSVELSRDQVVSWRKKIKKNVVLFDRLIKELDVQASSCVPSKS